MKLINDELIARFKEVGDQSEELDPIVVAKFFDPCGSATWYITRYDEHTQIGYCYVTGMVYDEWGSVYIPELESIKRPFGLTIERDLYTKEKRISEHVPELKRGIELARQRQKQEVLEQNRNNFPEIDRSP